MTSEKKVVIIDYELGNLFSVKQACETVGIQAVVGSTPEDLATAGALILPGVGAFKEAMNNLFRLDLVDTIKKRVAEKIPLMGICLGQQLMFSESEEFGACKGLDLVPGVIKKFPSVYSEIKVKVPQIGWNRVAPFDEGRWAGSPMCDIHDKDFMYFVHSYYVTPETDEFKLATTNYMGMEYCSAVFRDNLFATQFHPEKSGTKGLSIYKNWATQFNLL